MTTAKERPVQGSMFPDVKPDRPTGRVLPSVFVGTNAELIAALAPYYLTGSVCDVTYGEGKWWDRYRPGDFTAHDKFKLDGVDFTDLPEADDTYDAVAFDPPYVPQGGLSTRSDAIDFRDRFGLIEESTPWTATRELMSVGVAECARVTRCWLIAKCSDFVSGGRFHLGHRWVMDAATSAGLGDPWDIIIHHTGSGPGGHNIFDPVRARRHHSYLLVFRKGPGRVKGSAGMIGHLAPGMCDLTLLELLGNERIERYTVNHMRDLADMRRIQAFCDALGIDVRWELRRITGEDLLHVLGRPAGGERLDLGGAE